MEAEAIRIYSAYLLGIILGGLVGVGIHTVRYLNRPAWAHPTRSWHKSFAVGSLAGLSVAILAPAFGWTVPEWEWVLVALLGAFVGMAELASRYRDEPTKALFTKPAMLYMSLNALASVAALPLSRSLVPPQSVDGHVDWHHVLAAGFGAMVLLRSSVFRVRVGGHDGSHDVDVGPSTLLQSVIDAADRAVDRVRAQERAWTVARVMENVAFDKALLALPPYLCALMQNLNSGDQDDFTEQIAKIRTGQESEQTKLLRLGLLAMNHMGEGVLRAAVDSLAVEIRHAAVRTEDAAVQALAAARAAEDGAAMAADAAAAVAAVAPTDLPTEVKHATAASMTAASAAADAAKAATDQTSATVEAAAATAMSAASLLAVSAEATDRGSESEAVNAIVSAKTMPLAYPSLNGGPDRN